MADMETLKIFLIGLMITAGFAILMVLSVGCSNGKIASDSCQQASLETWTDEFITRMNAGYLPDDANQMAELRSVKTLAICMDEQKENN